MSSKGDGDAAVAESAAKEWKNGKIEDASSKNDLRDEVIEEESEDLEEVVGFTSDEVLDSIAAKNSLPLLNSVPNGPTSILNKQDNRKTT